MDRIAAYLRRTLAGERSPGVRPASSRPVRRTGASGRRGTARSSASKGTSAMRSLRLLLIKLAVVALLALVVLPFMIRHVTASIVDGIVPGSSTPTSPVIAPTP